MAPVTIKCAPAVEDRTVERSNSYEESWEAVLFEKQEDEAGNEQTKTLSNTRPVSTKAERAEIFEILEERNWESLVSKIKKQPEIASVVLSNGTAAAVSPLDISGNYILHELVKHDPPLMVVRMLISANENVLKARGTWGYLPLHFACTSGASSEVVEALLDGYPDGVMAKDSNDHMLPLHLACRQGADAEVLMALLTAYPEATTIRDDFGQTPLDYGRNIRSRNIRSDVISCLEIGKWLCESSRAAKARAERQFEVKLKNVNDDHSNEIDEIHGKHNEEKTRLLDFIKVHELNAKDLEKKLASRNTRVEELEQSLENQARDFESRIEAEKKSLAKTEVALDVKTAEAKDISKKLEEAKRRIVDVEKQLQDSQEQHEAALEEIDTLTQRLEKMESLMSSIRHLAENPKPRERSETRDIAPESERMNKFRAKALKIGKKARTGNQKRAGADGFASSPPKTRASTHAEVVASSAPPPTADE